MSIYLGDITSVEIGDQDVTPRIAGLTNATMKVAGTWDTPDGALTFPPGSTRLLSYRAHKTSFTLRLDIAPWFYRQVTGRRHPRITRMRAAYRLKTRRRNR